MTSPIEGAGMKDFFFLICHSIEFQLFFFIYFFLFISNTLFTYKFQTFKGKKTKDSRIIYHSNHEIPDFIATFRVKCQDFQTYFTRIWFGILANFPVFGISEFFSETEKTKQNTGGVVFFFFLSETAHFKKSYADVIVASTLEGQILKTLGPCFLVGLLGRGDKLENFDLIFSPLLKHGRGY